MALSRCKCSSLACRACETVFTPIWAAPTSAKRQSYTGILAGVQPILGVIADTFIYIYIYTPHVYRCGAFCSVSGSTRRRRHGPRAPSLEAGACVSLSRKLCSWSQTCCCSMSLPTIWTSTLSSGSTSTWRFGLGGGDCRRDSIIVLVLWLWFTKRS